jgi:8-oxo-dGTP pyrophosphatase MutT (NUDIX family)
MRQHLRCLKGGSGGNLVGITGGPAFRNITKKSFGLACCRYSTINELEFLLIHKRVSFCFIEFVNGRYRRGDRARLYFLLAGMTNEEKIDVWSLDFTRMWFRIWLVDADNKGTDREHYERYRSRRTYFKECHLSGDKNGTALKEALKSTKCSNTIWELPKGRPNSTMELPLNCAIREFKEETGFGPENYTLIPAEPTLCTVIHADNVKYVSNYYVAMAHSDAQISAPIHLDYSSDTLHQIAEVIDIRWISLKEMANMVAPQLYAAAKTLATSLKKRKLTL